MNLTPRIIRLESGDAAGTVRFLSGLSVELAEGKTSSVVTITRTGKFRDPRYGEFEITKPMLLAMVKNFDARVYGQDIFLDVAHNPNNGAAAKVMKLMIEGDRLRALVEWTPYGIDAIKSKSYQYLSAEYHENYQDNEAGLKHGTVLLGAALTVRPVIKNLDPIQLAEATHHEHPTLLHPELVRTLTQEITKMKDLMLMKLAAALALFPILTDGIRKQLAETFGAALEGVTEDAQAQRLLASFTDSGKILAESMASNPGAPVTLSIGAGLNAEEVKKLLAEESARLAGAVKQLAQAKENNLAQFTALLEKATGIDEPLRKSLALAAELITAEMTSDQVLRLAENQIRLGNEMMAQRTLAARGFAGPQGSARITVDESNAVKALQETVDRRLGYLDMSDSERFKGTGGALLEKNKKFCEKVLAEFDADRGVRLHEEHKQLAGGVGSVSDTAIPASFERTVIREALYNLISLQFMDVGTYAYANVINIPYSYRDTSAAGIDDLRKYEGQGILNAGYIQTLDETRPIPQKLAFTVSDEIRLLTGNGQIAYDILAENTQNAARIVGEDIERLNFNEILNASEEFGAVAFAATALTGVNGTNRTFIAPFFPIVRPRRIFDIKGVQVGATQNPVVVSYAATPINAYNGTNTQTAGTYYVLDYNLGEIYFVTQLGVLVTPPNATAITVAASRSTNVFSFNTDLAVDELDEIHWNDFLYRFGLRKTIIEDDRYRMANFSIMRGALMTQIEKAKQFGANSKRPGTDLTQAGNLGMIKDVPGFKAVAPGLAIADQRLVMGERNTSRFRMLKPWAMEQLENVKDSNGLFTGQKHAYGTQHVAVHTPIPLKNCYTSMLAYSAAARVNRV